MTNPVNSLAVLPTYHEQSALRQQLAEISQGILACFSLSELQTLCFDLGIDYDELSGAEMTEKVQHLLETLQSGNHLPELLAYCREQRPAYTWPTLAQEEPALVLSAVAVAAEPPAIAVTPSHLLGRLAKSIEKQPIASLLYYLLVERNLNRAALDEWLKVKKQANQSATPATPLNAPPATRLLLQRDDKQLVIIWPWLVRADLVALVASLGLRGNIAVSGRLFGVTLLVIIFTEIARNFLMGDFVTAFFCLGPFVGPVSYLLLAHLLNRTVITATADGLTVRHRPLPWPGNRTLLRSAISQLYCAYQKSQKFDVAIQSGNKEASAKQIVGTNYTLYAILESNKQQKILAGIRSLEEAIYIEQELETKLGIKDMAVTAQHLQSGLV